MRRLAARLALIHFALALSCLQAAVILDITSELSPGDPVQSGRLVRDGIISDWSEQKDFPGVFSTGTLYRYHVYGVNLDDRQFIQISFDDIAGTALTFASAYVNAYMPTGAPPNFGLDTNYLGDAGTSGNFFGIHPITFQVVAPAFSRLLVVVNDTSPIGAGVGEPYGILVEAFYDAAFSEIPEPASVILTGTVLAGLVALRRVRRIAVGRGAA